MDINKALFWQGDPATGALSLIPDNLASQAGAGMRRITNEQEIRDIASQRQQYYNSLLQRYPQATDPSGYASVLPNAQQMGFFGQDVGALSLDQLLSGLGAGAQKQDITSILGGGSIPSGYITNPETGKPQLRTQYESDRQAQIDAGQMTQVGTAPGGQPLYAPTGSPGAQVASGMPANQIPGFTGPQAQQQLLGNTGNTQGYQGNSIVDYLNSIGQASDDGSRAKLAMAHGIQNYTGTASQNIALLNKLRNEQTPLSTPTTSATQGTQNPAPTAGTDIAPESNPLIEGYGFDRNVLDNQSQKSPYNAFVDAYTALYKDLGLSSIKEQFDALNDQYRELEDKKNDEIRDVNENPWLTEGVRQKRIQNINSKYEDRELTLSNQMKTAETMYDRGLEEVKFVAGQAMQASHNQQVLDQQWAMKAMELAQRQAESELQFQRQVALKSMDNKGDFTLSPGSIRYDEEGNIVAYNPKSEDGGGYKTPSQTQYQAATFAQRMSQSEEILASGKGFFVPGLPTPFYSEDRRLFEQAERNFITAVLRRESGAAISETEFADARRVYIPLATDSPEVLARKAESRRIVMAGLVNEAGYAWDELGAALGGAQTPQGGGASFSDISVDQIFGTKQTSSGNTFTVSLGDGSTIGATIIQ